MLGLWTFKTSAIQPRKETPLYIPGILGFSGQLEPDLCWLVVQVTTYMLFFKPLHGGGLFVSNGWLFD